MPNATQTSVIERANTDYNFYEECLAMQLLSGAEFKMYRYFCNFPKGAHVYKRKEFSKLTGANPRTADLNFDALVNKGYLKLKEFGTYIFFTTPEEKTVNTP